MGDPIGQPGSTPKKDVVKEVLVDWVKNFDTSRTETAIVVFGRRPLNKKGDLSDDEPVCGYTKDKDKLLEAIENMPESNGTNYNSAFLYDIDKPWIKKT